MSNLLQEIEAQIAGVKTSVAKQNVGIVREISDGVAKIEGLTDAMLNEMLDFGNGVTGIALNLEETEVGAIILGDYTSVKEGQEVRTTGKLLQVPVGKAMLGRVVNALGVDAMTNSGMWKVPVQITTSVVPKEKSTTDMGLATLKPVLEVIKKINTELNLRKLITMILDTAIEFCNAQRGTIVVFEGEKFKIELSRDRQKHELKRLEMASPARCSSWSATPASG